MGNRHGSMGTLAVAAVIAIAVSKEKKRMIISLKGYYSGGKTLLTLSNASACFLSIISQWIACNNVLLIMAMLKLLPNLR